MRGPAEPKHVGLLEVKELCTEGIVSDTRPHAKPSPVRGKCDPPRQADLKDELWQLIEDAARQARKLAALAKLTSTVHGSDCTVATAAYPHRARPGCAGAPIIGHRSPASSLSAVCSVRLRNSPD